MEYSPHEYGKGTVVPQVCWKADIAVLAIDPHFQGYGNPWLSVYPAKPGSPGSESNFPAKPTHLVRAVIQETRRARRYFFSATALFRSVSFAAKTKVTAP